MEPVGPWSTYPYNRLAGVQAPTTTGDLHHLPVATTSGVSTTTAQILPAGFLSPPPVGYEVFSPLFHPTGAKPPAHYVNQHRPTLVQPQTGAKQPTEGEYHQQFFDQGWGQNSPFGILPHENIVAKNYENFNSPQFTAAQKQVQRGRSPVKSPPSQFFQPPSTIANVQQTCVVTSATNSVSKDYRVPQVRTPQGGPRPVEKNFSQKQIQTKAQSKVYPERTEETQSNQTPSGFPIDNRVSYSINGNKRNYAPNYQGRVYQNEEFNRGGNDPSVSVPRKPHSPAYPMYNSPMNSISSPQNSNQVTPPLDASVSRANPPQQGNVAYSSVITRTNEKFPNNQHCWDERRKFPQQANFPNVNQQYYDSSNNQVTMTELSSCRGDPMSIIKNLSQNSAPEIKQEDRKRRKSGEKDPTMEPYYHSPIPPPARSSAVNQQPQNGTYFEFDRWNQQKIFGAQPPMHQQQLMVPHPHGPPPPLPYFPSFHIPHHSSEYPSSVELTPISNYSEQSPQQPAFQQPEEQSKVIVPNIEEELNFLSEVDSRIPTTSKAAPPPPPVVAKPVEQKKDAGFMNSYLKFLQGEKDSSPPPPSRGNRKSAWSRANRTTSAAQQEPKVAPNPQTNGTVPSPQQQPQPQKITTAATTPKSSRLSVPQGDPQDDPRYFPLPKERKKNSFNDSDDSDDGFFHKNQPILVKQEGPRDKIPDKNRKKGRPPKPGGPSERKRERDLIKAEKVKKLSVDKRKIKMEPEPVLRRELSKRAAKEKINIQQLLIGKDDDIDDPYADSDSDPAWTPLAKDDDDDDLPVKKMKKGRKKVRSLMSPERLSDEYSNDGHRKRKKEHKLPKSHDGNSQSGRESPAAEEGFFKAGEFVVIQTELGEEWPAIWRVDGKTLLQKYEPFEQNGQTLYRNISTYTSWTPDSKKQYIAVPVRYRSQSQLETIVEFLRTEMTFVNQEFLDRVLKENETYQDNFEVYIQTLISQALDSNFLTEIFQEKDDYFLSNVQTIDDITKSKCDKFLELLQWPSIVQNSICTWPCYNLLREAGIGDSASKTCSSCKYPGISMRVLLYGQPYNSTTLEGCQPDPQVPCEKDFLMCRICGNRVQLLNKIIHQKYLMYIECAKRVAEKRTSDPQKDTTCILNELLADEAWLNQLFLEVRSCWAEVDGLEQNHRARNHTNE